MSPSHRFMPILPSNQTPPRPLKYSDEYGTVPATSRSNAIPASHYTPGE
jgi:hypothetical protein